MHEQAPQTVDELPENLQKFIKEKDSQGSRLQLPHEESAGNSQEAYSYEEAVIACPPLATALLGALATGNQEALTAIESLEVSEGSE